MSRSKKQPFYTQQQRTRSTVEKRKAARRVRGLPKDEAPADGKAYRKHFDPWNIRDWSFKGEGWKAKRK